MPATCKSGQFTWHQQVSEQGQVLAGPDDREQQALDALLKAKADLTQTHLGKLSGQRPGVCGRVGCYGCYGGRRRYQDRSYPQRSQRECAGANGTATDCATWTEGIRCRASGGRATGGLQNAPSQDTKEQSVDLTTEEGETKPPDAAKGQTAKDDKKPPG